MRSLVLLGAENKTQSPAATVALRAPRRVPLRSLGLARLWVLFSALLVACSGDKPREIDAGDPACTKAIYDVCNTEHDCMSGMCHLFQADGFSACVQTCTMGGTPCPADSSGAAGTCNPMGICKPKAANACHL